MNGIAQAAISRFLSKPAAEVQADLGQAVRDLDDEKFRTIMNVVLAEIDRRWPE